MAVQLNPGDSQANNRLYLQLQKSLERLQNGQRLSSGTRSAADLTQANQRTARAADRVEISPEALAKAQQAASTPGVEDMARADQMYEAGKYQDAQQLVQQTIEMIRRQAQMGGQMTQTGQTGAGTGTGTAQETPAVEGAPAQQPPAETQTPQLASTAQLGDVTITNVQEVTDAEGNRIGATGQLDLSQYGLGTVAVDLALEGDQVVGATSQQNTYNIDVGGNTFTLTAGEGQNLLTVDAQGNTTFTGTATANIGNQQLELGNATVTVGEDAAGNDTVRIQGLYGQQGAGTQVAVEYNAAGTVNAEVSFDVVGDLVPGFDKVTDFLSRVGVDVDTGAGVKVSFDKNQGAVSVDVAGIRGSYNQNTGEFSIGGLEVGAGISVGLEDLTINTKTGAVSGEISAGVGVGVGGVGVGIDLAGFAFAYDPKNGDITLTGTQGIAAANLEATVKLSRGSNGQYGVKSVSFRANVDEQLAREVAAGLNEAYKQGVNLGNQAAAEFGRVAGQGEQAVRDFAKGLSQAGGNLGNFLTQTAELGGAQLRQFVGSAADAGNRMGDFLTQAGRFSGTQLNQFLSTASQAGGNLGTFLTRTANLSGTDLTNFVSSASKAGNQLGTLLKTAGGLSGKNLSNFLSAAASKGSQVGSFVNNFSSMMTDINRITGGVANLSVNKSGGISGTIKVPGAGSMNVSFSRKNGALAASGTLNIGGFGFSNAEVTFNKQGGLASVKGGASISTPKFKVLGKKIGSQKIGFELELSKGKVVAKGKLSVNLGWLGRHGASFTLGSGGFSTKVF